MAWGLNAENMETPKKLKAAMPPPGVIDFTGWAQAESRMEQIARGRSEVTGVFLRRKQVVA